jgi:hypothetical protein
VQHGRVAHHRFDQRARGVGIHVPQRFLHAEGEDVGVALQGFVQVRARGLALLHPDQEVAADQGRHREAAEHHQQQRAVQRAPVQRAAGAGAARVWRLWT